MTQKRERMTIVFVSLIFSVGFILLFSATTSPLYVANGQDSCGYIMMGTEIVDGIPMYSQISDNKGPVMWLLEAAGQFLVRGRVGVIFVQIPLLFLDLILLSYGCRKLWKLSWKQQVFLEVIFLICLQMWYQRGNLTEEYSIFFIILSFYQYTRLHKNIHTYKSAAFVLGISFTGVLFIRMNDVLSICVFGLFAFILLIASDKQKRLKHIGFFVLYFILGVSAVFLPIYFYYSSNGIWGRMLEEYIGVGTGYAGNNMSFPDGAVTRLKLILVDPRKYITIGIVIIALFCNKGSRVQEKNMRRLLVFVPCSMILASVVKPVLFLHYCMPLSISIALSAGYLMKEQAMQYIREHKKVMVSALGIVALTIIFFAGYESATTTVGYLVGNRGDKRYQDMQEAAGAIPDDERNQGFTFSSPLWYIATDTKPSIGYVWTDTLLYREELKKKFEEELPQNPPRWLVFLFDQDFNETIESYQFSEETEHFFYENYYLEKENDTVTLYRLKE